MPTRIALIADAHVANHKRWGGPVVGGLNQRGWECVHVLEAASKYAKGAKCVALVVLGDLFDNTRPSPALVSATIGALCAGGIPVHILLGNHDRQSMHNLDNACASMDWVEGVTVYDQPAIVRFMDLDVAMIPYQAGEAKDWLAAGLAAVAPNFSVAGSRAVLTHCGIWDDDTPAYLKAAKDAVGIGHVRWLCEAHKIDLLAAGNWHAHQLWAKRKDTPSDPTVLIPGTVCPHNFSDPQDHGSVFLLDTLFAVTGGKNLTAHHLPTPLFLKSELGPRFQAIDGELKAHYGVAQAVSKRELGVDVPRAYVRLTVRRDEIEKAHEVRSFLETRHPGTVVHVEVREQEAEASVREAARAAVRAGESSSTLLDYADATTIEEPGTKGGVVRRLEEYRKAAG